MKVLPATNLCGQYSRLMREESNSLHKWPFDIEQQLILSSLADADLGAANEGVSGTSGAFDGGVKAISFPQVTQDPGPPGSGGSQVAPGGNRGHSAIITMYEACWFTSWGTSFAKDSGMIMETGDVSITDVHDFASVYGEFLASGNDPTIGQLGSVRYAQNGFNFGLAGGGIGGGGTIAPFLNPT